MPLSRQSVGTHRDTSSHATRQGTLGHSRLSSLSHRALILAKDRNYCARANLHSSSHHLSLNCEGRSGTIDDFATYFLHFSLFSTALCVLVNSRPVHSQMLSSNLFLCLPLAG